MIHGFSDRFNVSRETTDKLIVYQKLLEKWNRKINLVAPGTIDDATERHFADSLQLFSLREREGVWIDLGSGGGFPGLVVAIAAKELAPDLQVHLVESDTRKCAFLRTVSRETSVGVTVHSARIENLPSMKANVVSARALAPLPKLLEMSENLLCPDGIGLYLKGESCDEELAEAKKRWRFEHEEFASETAQKAKILRIRNIHRGAGS